MLGEQGGKGTWNLRPDPGAPLVPRKLSARKVQRFEAVGFWMQDLTPCCEGGRDLKLKA